MLARMPPSQQHLAVKEGKEDEAYAKVAKEENYMKSARYCPFIIRCRECGNHVGNVTYVASKLLVCYKVENLYLFNGVEEMKMKKLKVMASFLQNLGVEVIEYLPSEETCQSLQSNEPMKYCDISGLTYMSRDIDSLTHQVPRNYQRELFLSAMRGNTLVYLPTGSGKTLVAAMVFGCMKQLNPGKFMVFIVDRIPLAYQQSAYFKSQLPHLRVETLTGEMEPFKKKTVHQALANKTVDILVLTHQIFLDSIAVGNSAIQLLGISVLVFDEAHHCAGGHPYNKIMIDFYEKVTPDSFKPLVLGLTASPAGEITTERTIEKLQKLLKNLHCNITMPVQSDDLVAHVNAPNTSYDEVATTDVRQIVLETLIMEHIKDLESTPGFQQALSGLVVFSSHFRGALRNLIDRCHGDNSQVETLIIGQHMMRLLSVIDVSRVLCYKDALVYLNDCINSVIQATSPCQSALKKLIGTKHTFLTLKNHAAEGVKDDHPMSDRYRCLENRIQQFICRVEKDPTSRGIIFVCMRKTAYKLREKLRSNSHVSRLLNPAAFVGHGDGNYDGMAWKDEQEVILRDFKLGEIKLLVSTSVLEEGLDVPVCNLVIRFEGAATLRSLVQSRGRASRRTGSEFVVICSEKEKFSAMSLIDKEENMRCAVTNVMDSEVAKSQALEFKCEIKRPDLTRRETKEVENSRDVKRYTPTVTVVVQVFEKQESHEQNLKIVTNNLESAFNVEPTRLLPTESLSGLRVQEDDESCQIALILKQKDDMRDEFRSKDEFICNISEVWCNMMTNEELLNIWLHPLLPRRCRKLIEPFHILPATSLFLGTLVTRCHFQYEWPSEPVLKKVTMRFDHSYNMLTVFFVRRRRNYKLEIRYDEFEDFVLVDSNTTNLEIIRVFFSVRHPPRLYQDVDHFDNEDGDDIDNNGDDDNDGDNSVQDEGIDVSDISDNDSENENFSTDDEYPDVVRNFHNRSIPDYADDAFWWERVVDVQGGEKAWGECFTYCFTITPKESPLLRSLLTTIDGRYGKKAFYCWVKNTYGRFPQINIPDELEFEVSYTFDSILTSHPSARGRLDESRLVDLLQNRNANVVVACLEKLRKALERNPFCNPHKILERLLTGEIKVESKQIQNQVPCHCALIKRVVITPTRVLLYPSEVMVKNRVLRHYERDDFLCVVSFREENLSKLSIGRGSIDLLLDNINQVLNNGLNIARKPFNFLASSNSQLRNHSCWFVGPSIPPEDVRRWMGDFTHIRLVTVYLNRLVQVSWFCKQGLVDHLLRYQLLIGIHFARILAVLTHWKTSSTYILSHPGCLIRPVLFI